ncbi:MAG: hypothetical protein ACKN81_19405, partial [Pirellulaceae bacterium]
QDLSNRSIWIVLAIFGSLVGIGLLTRLILGWIRSSLVARIHACYRPEQILLEEYRANYFGKESAGVFQVRGNGALVLTATDLHFFMLVPKTEICIPISSIREMTITKQHLYKVTPFDLLKVVYSENDQIDSIAWYLSQPAIWKQRIGTLQAECRSGGEGSFE